MTIEQFVARGPVKYFDKGAVEPVILVLAPVWSMN